MPELNLASTYQHRHTDTNREKQKEREVQKKEREKKKKTHHKNRTICSNQCIGDGDEKQNWERTLKARSSLK